VVRPSINQNQDIDVHDETVFVSSSSSLSSATKTVTDMSISQPVQSKQRRSAEREMNVIPDSGITVAKQGLSGDAKNISQQRHNSFPDDTKINSVSETCDLFMTPATQAEHHETADPQTSLAAVSAHDDSDIKRNMPQISPLEHESVEYHSAQQRSPAMRHADRTESSAETSRHTRFDIEPDKVEQQRTVLKPVEQFNDPAVATDLRIIEKNTPGEIVATSSRATSSAPNVQVRIGNIQVEVHQPVASRSEPVTPQHAERSTTTSRPTRLSRHYLRGW
jgi:hypothetical protein